MLWVLFISGCSFQLDLGNVLGYYPMLSGSCISPIPQTSLCFFLTAIDSNLVRHTSPIQAWCAPVLMWF